MNDLLIIVLHHVWAIQLAIIIIQNWRSFLLGLLCILTYNLNTINTLKPWLIAAWLIAASVVDGLGRHQPVILFRIKILKMAVVSLFWSISCTFVVAVKVLAAVFMNHVVNLVLLAIWAMHIIVNWQMIHHVLLLQRILQVHELLILFRDVQHIIVIIVLLILLLFFPFFIILIRICLSICVTVSKAFAVR